MIGTDCICSCKFNYHTITTRTDPTNINKPNNNPSPWIIKRQWQAFSTQWYTIIRIHGTKLSNYKSIKVRYLVIMMSPNNLFRSIHFSMSSMQCLNPKSTFVTHKSTHILQVFKSKLTTSSSVLVLICKPFKTPLQYIITQTAPLICQIKHPGDHDFFLQKITIKFILCWLFYHCRNINWTKYR